MQQCFMQNIEAILFGKSIIAKLFVGELGQILLQKALGNTKRATLHLLQL